MSFPIDDFIAGRLPAAGFDHRAHVISGRPSCRAVNEG